MTFGPYFMLANGFLLNTFKSSWLVFFGTSYNDCAIS